MRLSDAIAAGLLLGFAHGMSVKPAPVTPSFTTTITENIRQIDFQTGTSYTVSGVN